MHVSCFRCRHDVTDHRVLTDIENDDIRQGLGKGNVIFYEFGTVLGLAYTNGTVLDLAYTNIRNCTAAYSCTVTTANAICYFK